MIGITELVVILAIVLLMFGSKKLPELADGMGKAIRNFKKGIHGEDEEDVTPRDVTPVDKQVAARSGASEVISASSDVAPKTATAERKA